MALKQKDSPTRLLTLPEVQSYLGVKSRKTILKYIKTQELPAYKLGGTRWRITLADVEAFIKKQQSPARPHPEGEGRGEEKKTTLTTQVSS